MGKNALVGQSGGPTSVINASLYGVIKEAWAQEGIDKVYGMVHGITGLIEDDLVDLNLFKDENGAPTEDFELLKHTPAAYLGSCRHKLKDHSQMDIIFKQLEKYNIGYFFYIGGNDSMDTVNQLGKEAIARGLDIKMIGVPKTIDNDLAITDHTPGFGSAAKYVAASTREVMLDAEAYSKPQVTIAEIMGRHAGWLTAAAALAMEGKDSRGMMIYLPEVVFDMPQFCIEVTKRLETNPKLFIAVSEGLRFADGRFVCEGEAEAEKDSFGHATLSGCVKEMAHALRQVTKVKIRQVEFSTLQRSAAHCRSLTDMNESIMAGEAAVRAAIAGETQKMVCFVREAGDTYSISTQTADASQICNVEKTFPLEWITPDHFVTQDFFDYAKPLINGEPAMTYKDGLPQYVELKR